MSLNTFLRCLISFSKCWSLEHTLKALGTNVYSVPRFHVVKEEIVCHLSRFLKNDKASGDSFYLKLYARNNIFKHIKKKDGEDLIKAVRDFEQKKTKFEKLDADSAFI